MKTIYQHLAEIESSGIKAAFCIVTCTQGSSPQKSSSKMIVLEDGTIIGTVGGGSIEKAIISEALHVITEQEPKMLKYNLKKDLGMECGGNMEVYIEPVGRKNKLFIFGAGHIGKALANYAPDFGFDVTVVDERENIFTSYNGIKCKCVNSGITDAVKELSFDKSTFIVIVTHGHAIDYNVLKHICKKEHFYMGMIGSKRKTAEIHKLLLAENVMTKKEIELLDMPIGIKFAAVEPNEIALSILAKLIDVKNSQ